jgi:NADH:ubiquinone oxidoreductase subunit 5 (subunit L)/multisubunit Na+/H+ antiporter MnhA subunit
MLGSVTLFIARIAALSEIDAKKIVALSTLSQLGLMVLALFSGGVFICLFHLLIHALAKACLFLIVGRMIHFRFSQQDIRQISTGLEIIRIFIISFIRIIRLCGILFSSGFFSKESILITQYSVLNRMLT